MLWGWYHPCGCKFGRGLGRRAVGGCFGLAPPLRVQGRQAAARIRQTRVSVWAIPGGKMGGVAPEDGRDRNAKPPMLQRAFLRPLRSVPRVALGWHPPLRAQVWEGFRAESGWRLLWVDTALRVQGRQAAARIRQTRVSVWAIPGGKMGGVATEDGRDRNAKPPMLQRAFLRPLRSVPRGVCGIAAGRPSDGRSEAVNRQTGFAPPNSVFFLFPHT